MDARKQQILLVNLFISVGWATRSLLPSGRVGSRSPSPIRPFNLYPDCHHRYDVRLLVPLRGVRMGDVSYVKSDLPPTPVEKAEEVEDQRLTGVEVGLGDDSD